MADRQEWIRALNGIREALASELKPELPSARSREAVENIDMTLARMVVDLRNGEHIAGERLARWEALRDEFRAIAGGPAPTDVIAQGAEPFAQLENLMATLQRDFDRHGLADGFVGELATPGSRADRWLASTSEALLDFASAYEKGLSPAPLPEPMQDMAAEESRLRAALNTWLAQRFTRLPANPVESLRIVTGGLGKRTALLRLIDNSELPRRLVLRADIAAGATAGTTVIREFPLLQELHARGIAVPQPILLEPDPRIIGGAFIVVSEIEDATLCGIPFVEDRRLQRAANPLPDAEFCRELARTLARLHGIRHMPGGSAQENSSAAMIEDWIDTWRCSVKGPFSLVSDLCFAWLRAHPLPADRPRAVIHGDVSAHNILVRNGRLAALLDWETAREGDPAEDLGYCRLLLVDGVLPWEEFIAEYLNAGGDARACDARAVNFWAVWTWAMASTRTTIVRKFLQEGVRSDIRAGNYAWHFFLRMQYYGARELQRAIVEPSP
jgi:aminoglycoside phosphotransferase (APT) family kinase protein